MWGVGERNHGERKGVGQKKISLWLFTISEDSDESDSFNYLFVCDESESESDHEKSRSVTVQEGTSTRSGCRVEHWSTRYTDFVQCTEFLTGRAWSPLI